MLYMAKIVWLLPLILHSNIIFSSITIFTGFVRLADLWGFSFGLYLIWNHTGVLALLQVLYSLNAGKSTVGASKNSQVVPIQANYSR